MTDDPIDKFLRFILIIIAVASILLTLFGRDFLTINQFLDALQIQVAILLGFQAFRDGYIYFKSRQVNHLIYASIYIIIMLFYWLEL